MAFQDSCGTIILDAILTDVGRKRMAQGTFKVTKFALGDDEIDYSLRSTQNQLYKNPRIEALPVFEAFNVENAVINYGLTDHIRPDLYYMPDLKTLSDYVDTAASPYQNYYYVSVNDETTAKLRTALGEYKYILESNEPAKTKLIVGSGIQSNDIPSDKLSKERFLMNLGLYDSYYLIYSDSRFINNILTAPPQSYIYNDVADNIFSNFGPLRPKAKTSLPAPVAHYDAYRCTGVDNEIYPKTTEASTKLLPHSGSRGTVIGVNVNINEQLRGTSGGASAEEFYIFGRRGEVLFGGTDKYDYIDTTIYIEGLSSNSKFQAPLRIIRYAGT